MFVSTNTIAAMIGYYQSTLSSVYDKVEYDVIIAMVFNKFLGLSSSQLYLKRAERISESEMLLFHFALKRLAKGEPVQYVLEESYFYGLQFKVTNSVLIPRPETEELVELIIKEYSDAIQILEVGTGSGCIAIALKKQLPHINIVALDKSREALMVAQENAINLNAKVSFVEHDFLDSNKDRELEYHKWDLVVSNPPYIPLSQKSTMHSNVLDFEPHLALFVEEKDPLIFYKRIAEFSQKGLREGGKFAVEISDSLGKETLELFVKWGFKNVRLIRDINGNERIVTGEK